MHVPMLAASTIKVSVLCQSWSRCTTKMPKSHEKMQSDFINKAEFSNLDNLDHNTYVRVGQIDLVNRWNTFGDCIDNFCTIDASVCASIIQN